MKKELRKTDQYNDIIHLPRHVSGKHPQMPRRDRAAQFAPFAALSGHGAIIRETEENHVSDTMENLPCEEES